MSRTHEIDVNFGAAMTGKLEVNVEVIKGRQPPDDNSWFDWPFDDVLGQMYDWVAAHPEIMGLLGKISNIPQRLGLGRVRMGA